MEFSFTTVCLTCSDKVSGHNIFTVIFFLSEPVIFEAMCMISAHVQVH
jgi:hypothetical protein